jgi:transposase
MNQLRAILLERGVIVLQGRARLRFRVTELLRQSTEQLSSRIRLLIEDMLAAWQALDERIAAFDAEFAAEAKRNESARRLTSIPGIGALNATALVAAVGDAQTFARGRNLAAWLGLVPRQATTGGKPRLLGITKRGSKYLRKMLIQGARAALPTLSRGNTRLGQWLRGLRESSFEYGCRCPCRQGLVTPAAARYGSGPIGSDALNGSAPVSIW